MDESMFAEDTTMEPSANSFPAGDDLGGLGEVVQMTAQESQVRTS